MSLLGKLVMIDGDWYVEHSYPSFQEPAERITLRYKVLGSRVEGFGMVEVYDGLEVRYLSGSEHIWQAYQRGTYLVVRCEKQGTVTKTPYPCPKVKKGVEVRYRSGLWEKYLRTRGWVAA
jgi:hypothetical protein